ncbi:hypothetical protein [Vagococcus fluvialis]|uniref:hypothetical protein n=1 Tax=Vagococcus fluvialis TaxID=2738 RepID=UPI001A8C36BD|nr:hypothetical protein [Vagococcus fluvialis]MBO0486326.1 hypothetical protein [Vagococcus fluvialis]MCM2139240.1 hypothetical protein [Vagococcus fluvialis]
MTFKRFFQLFIFYVLSILVAYSLVVTFKLTSFWAIVLLMSVAGYIVLGLPLTLLSLKKKKY